MNKTEISISVLLQHSLALGSEKETVKLHMDFKTAATGADDNIVPATEKMRILLDEIMICANDLTFMITGTENLKSCITARKSPEYNVRFHHIFDLSQGVYYLVSSISQNCALKTQVGQKTVATSAK